MGIKGKKFQKSLDNSKSIGHTLVLHYFRITVIARGFEMTKKIMGGPKCQKAKTQETLSPFSRHKTDYPIVDTT